MEVSQSLSSNSRLDNAARLHRAGLFAKAAQIYRELAEGSDGFEGSYGLALISMQTNQFGYAEQWLVRACRLNSTSAAAWSLRGLALLRLKRPAEALDCIDRALAIEPQLADALGNRAIALFELQRLDDALLACDALLALHPANASTWCNRGNVLACLRRFGDAVSSYDRALSFQPEFREAANNRLYAQGMVEFESGRLDVAENLLNEALRQNPYLKEALCVRGVVLMRLNRHEDAIACFDRAIAAQPDFVEAISNRATACLELGRLDEAMRGFNVALAIDPRHAFSWNNRGNTFMKMKGWSEAVADYDRALSINPALHTAEENRTVALYALGRLDRAPPAQLRGLFDGYAPYYDQSMLDSLGYRGHIVMRELAGRLLPGAHGLKILDLGCGTGLVGEVFRDLAAGGRLEGVDISSAMIGKSRERGVYDNLIHGDIEDILASLNKTYDLIVSVDTMIYFGALERVLVSVRRRLNRGLFLFALEAKPGEGWEQSPTNRFRHSESYLRAVAAQSGFSVLAFENFHIRREYNEPVEGFSIALQPA